VRGHEAAVARRSSISCHAEQHIQGPHGSPHDGRAQEQSGCNGVRMSRYVQESVGVAGIGFRRNTIQRCVRKIELNDIKGSEYPSEA